MTRINREVSHFYDSRNTYCIHASKYNYKHKHMGQPTSQPAAQLATNASSTTSVAGVRYWREQVCDLRSVSHTLLGASSERPCACAARRSVTLSLCRSVALSLCRSADLHGET